MIRNTVYRIVFLASLNIISHPCQASDSLVGTHSDDVLRQARHLARNFIIPKLESCVYEEATQKFPDPSQWQEKTIYFSNSKGNIQFHLCHSIKVPDLNKNIIRSLKGEKVSFLGYEDAFEGLKELLQQEGFFLEEGDCLKRVKDE